MNYDTCCWKLQNSYRGTVMEALPNCKKALRFSLRIRLLLTLADLSSIVQISALINLCWQMYSPSLIMFLLYPPMISSESGQITSIIVQIGSQLMFREKMLLGILFSSYNLFTKLDDLSGPNCMTPSQPVYAVEWNVELTIVRNGNDVERSSLMFMMSLV